MDIDITMYTCGCLISWRADYFDFSGENYIYFARCSYLKVTFYIPRCEHSYRSRKLGPNRSLAIPTVVLWIRIEHFVRKRKLLDVFAESICRSQTRIHQADWAASRSHCWPWLWQLHVSSSLSHLDLSQQTNNAPKSLHWHMIAELVSLYAFHSLIFNIEWNTRN